MSQCQFKVAWVGQCKEPVAVVFGQPATRCGKHLRTACRVCGALATHDCPETFTLVCGTPLCDKCRCPCLCPEKNDKGQP